jgi:cyclic dehypoxanthinyl futalosine synthase
MTTAMDRPENKTTRYDRRQARELLSDLPMGQLMNLAHQEGPAISEGTVTFVVDTNPNYTNVCVTGCAFCAFCRKSQDTDAYLLSPQTVAGKWTPPQKGATTVLLQGGHQSRRSG